ncbi:MAG: phosphoglucomutase/phosphomannomutase family protein [Bacteroidota bacterium]
MRKEIKFGTDGWRAIIAKDFTTDNVARVAQATASWLLQEFPDKQCSVLIGHDTRFAGELFAETCAKVIANCGIKVFLSRGFASTPMISFGTMDLKADVGIVITASHNPPSYNGFKLKGAFGGPLLPENVKEVESLIPEKNNIDLDSLNIEEFEERRLLEYVDLETIYCERVEANFDLDSIKRSGLGLAYDAMYGAGQNAMKRLLPDITFLHCDYNPSFKGQPPEPIDRNLKEFSEMIKRTGNIDCGLATDGDADRLGMFGSQGNFIDSHHLILLLIHYFCKYKGMKGKVCTAFSTTVKIRKMCEHYGLELEVVPIGFKHICKIMLKEDVLLGGEESGGIAVRGHIPERDGIWIGLIIWEFMAKSGKTINELIKEIYDIVGPFVCDRSDLHLKEEQKQKIVENCINRKYTSFGDYKVQRVEGLDGYKYYFSDDEWYMIRPSGTEPVLRTYAEAATKEEVLNILKVGYDTLIG